MVILILGLSGVHAQSNDTGDNVKLQSKNNTQLSVLSLKAAKDTSFKGLQNDINKSSKKLYLNSNYQKVESDSPHGIIINKSNILIDGCGHTVDAKASSRIFDIYGRNVTITNMILANADSGSGSAIYVNPKASVKTINVTFRGCQNKNSGTVSIDIRQFYTNDNDEVMPTSKGVRLNAESLLELLSGLARALEANEVMDLCDTLQDSLQDLEEGLDDSDMPEE